MNEAIELFTKKSDCGLNEKEAIYCYGMSKMTVTNENDDSSKYSLLQFVEFLEMICRAA